MARSSEARGVAVGLEEAGLGRQLAEHAHGGPLGLARGIWHAVDIDLLGRGNDLHLGLGGGGAAEGLAKEALAELVCAVVPVGLHRCGSITFEPIKTPMKSLPFLANGNMGRRFFSYFGFDRGSDFF